MYIFLNYFGSVRIFGETKVIMSVIIRIDRRTIKPNPDYGIPFIILEGRKTIDVFSPRELPKKVAKYFALTGYTIGAEDEINEVSYALIGKMPKSVYNYLSSNSKNGVTTNYQSSPRIVDNSHAPEYFFKYRNPRIPCSHCGELVKFNHIETEYTDEGYSYEVCPICHEADSFDYKLESILESTKTK